MDLLAPNFSNDIFGKLGASKSTLDLMLQKFVYFIYFISPLSNKKALILFYVDRGDKYIKNIKKILF